MCILQNWIYTRIFLNNKSNAQDIFDSDFIIFWESYFISIIYCQYHHQTNILFYFDNWLDHLGPYYHKGINCTFGKSLCFNIETSTFNNNSTIIGRINIALFFIFNTTEGYNWKCILPFEILNLNCWSLTCRYCNFCTTCIAICAKPDYNV